MDQGAIHLYPMATDVKSHQQLEHYGILRIELTENHEETCCGTSVRGKGKGRVRVGGRVGGKGVEEERRGIKR